jgi:hypothetical protein
MFCVCKDITFFILSKFINQKSLKDTIPSI